MSPSARRLRKEKKLRDLELRNRSFQADKIKDIFGKPNPQVRNQLYSLMKDKADYKKQLKMMKKLFIGGK